jgi:hypothetical protein
MPDILRARTGGRGLAGVRDELTRDLLGDRSLTPSTPWSEAGSADVQLATTHIAVDGCTYYAQPGTVDVSATTFVTERGATAANVVVPDKTKCVFLVAATGEDTPAIRIVQGDIVAYNPLNDTAPVYAPGCPPNLAPLGVALVQNASGSNFTFGTTALDASGIITTFRGVILSPAGAIVAAGAPGAPGQQPTIPAGAVAGAPDGVGTFLEPEGVTMIEAGNEYMHLTYFTFDLTLPPITGGASTGPDIELYNFPADYCQTWFAGAWGRITQSEGNITNDVAFIKFGRQAGDTTGNLGPPLQVPDCNGTAYAESVSTSATNEEFPSLFVNIYPASPWTAGGDSGAHFEGSFWFQWSAPSVPLPS